MLRYIIILCFILSFPAIGNNVFFEDFNTNPESRWEFISDQVMGGTSIGQIEFLIDKDKTYARMTGNVSIENNGGFIQFRRKLIQTIDEDSNGIRIEVRGNIEEYFIHIRTAGTILPWQYYQAPFLAKNNWQYIKVPFNKFKRSGIMLSKILSPDSIKSIAIVAYGKEHKAVVDINIIEIY
jgi:hypothetical protein